MKKIILFEILRALKSYPNLMRKIKIFAVAGLIGLVLIVGLSIWAGATAIKYVATAANEVTLSPSVQTQIGSIKSELEQIKLQPHSCWEKAQSLIALEPWLKTSALENFNSLKTSCFNSESIDCKDAQCKNNVNHLNSKEWSTL